MFTVCPKCALTLVVTAADLRAAQGYVRCGRCSNVFNALARLVEDRASAAATQVSPPPEQPQAPLEADGTELAQAQESQGEELEGEPEVAQIEVEETRTEETQPEEAQAEQAPAAEGDEPIPEGALEFNPQATDVSKVFVEATPTPQWTAATGSFKALILKSDGTPAQPRQEPPWQAEAKPQQEKDQRRDKQEARVEEKEPAAARASGEDAASAPVDEARVDQLLSESARSGPGNSEPAKLEASDGGTAGTVRPPQRPQRLQPKPGPKPVPEPVASTTQAESAAPPRTPPEPQAAPRPHAPAAAVRLAPDKPAPKPIAAIARPQTARAEPTAEEAGARLAPWWNAATAALAIILAAQIVNHYRNDLAANERLHKPLTALYAALGVPLAPRWDLEAYDVRQLGASVDSAASGQITVRASVKNGARQAQPLPLLRVTLQDRFGNRVAARDVPPQSYLPRALPSSSFLSAGQRIDAEMVFVDPGANAVGFEIDACLPAAGGAITCASDAGSH